MESFLNFVENHVPSVASTDAKWKVLVVDDEEDVHKITELVLKPLEFDDRSLEFYHAYTASDAFLILKHNPDIAIVLLDVVMESDDAGLILVKKIREELKNRKIRIILRTGQPGQAPEKSVISKFDINDYKEKTELTTTKLFTSIISSLRSYKDLSTLEEQKVVIEEKSFLNQYILNTMPCKSLLIDKSGTAISCNNTANGTSDPSWICKTVEGKCTEECNWLQMDIPMHSNERKRWEYKTHDKTYEVCYFPEENDIRLVYAFDITERAKIEKEKISLERQLVQSQKMEAIGLLASGIVHDFNNYLTAISGFAQIISNGKDSNTVKLYTNKIVNSVERASKLISRLLTFSRKGDESMAPVKINTLILDSIELLKPKSRLVSIKFEEVIDDAYIFGDSNALQNTFLNLGINAIDAMPEGGELKYRIAKFEDNGFNESYLSVEVQDSGIGIDSDTIQRIFEPFYTTKGEGKGTGLGLAGAYGCLKKHNGLISVQSEKGCGTTFKLLLPRLRHSKIDSIKNYSSSLPKRNTKSEIGIYALDSVTLTTLGTLFEDIGHNVSTFSSDLNMLENSIEFFNKNLDVLVFDLDDIHESKVELFSKIIQRVNIKSLLIIANDTGMDNRLWKNKNCVILNKPFKYDQLINSFAKALELNVQALEA